MAKKQRSSDSDAPASTRISWDTGSKAALIDFLLEHKLEAGDRINFKVPTFKKAAIHLIPFTLKGGAKSAASCKNKWAQMKDTYLAVQGLMEQSGFTWTEHDGANIIVESESMWEAYVKQFLLTGSFCNGGWCHFDDMIPLMPTTAKGTNVIHASQAVTGADGDLDDWGSSSGNANED